jgi:hypothetical protein
MIRGYLFLVILFFTLSLVLEKVEAAGYSDETESTTEILKGSRPGIGDPIRAVAVKVEGSGSLCSGTRVSRRHVVTAGHCLDDRPVSVVFADDSQYSVSRYWRHPRYKKDSTGPDGQFDIGVIELATEPAQGPVATLADTSATPKKGEAVWIAGYGKDEYGKVGTLRAVQVVMRDPLYNLSEVRVAEKGNGACDGDSGGPGYVIKGDRVVLWGVDSMSDPESDRSCGGGEIYGRVAAGRTWILSIIKNNRPEGFEDDSFETLRAPGKERVSTPYAGRTCRNTGDEMFCMVCNIYFESALEPYIGKVQVGRTVMERKKMGSWGGKACSVIWAYKQFSWTWVTRHITLPSGGVHLDDAYRAAKQALKEGPNGASHYYNPRLANPSWARNCRRAPIYQRYTQRQIGQHLFLACQNSFLEDLNLAFVRGGEPRSTDAEEFMTSGSFLRFDQSGEPITDPDGRQVSELTRESSRLTPAK